MKSDREINRIKCCSSQCAYIANTLHPNEHSILQFKKKINMPIEIGRYLYFCVFICHSKNIQQKAMSVCF